MSEIKCKKCKHANMYSKPDAIGSIGYCKRFEESDPDAGYIFDKEENRGIPCCGIDGDAPLICKYSVDEFSRINRKIEIYKGK